MVSKRHTPTVSNAVRLWYPLPVEQADIIDVDAAGAVRDCGAGRAYADAHLPDLPEIHTSEAAQRDLPFGPRRGAHNRWIWMDHHRRLGRTVLDDHVQLTRTVARLVDSDLRNLPLAQDVACDLHVGERGGRYEARGVAADWAKSPAWYYPYPAAGSS